MQINLKQEQNHIRLAHNLPIVAVEAQYHSINFNIPACGGASSRWEC